MSRTSACRQLSSVTASTGSRLDEGQAWLPLRPSSSSSMRTLKTRLLDDVYANLTEGLVDARQWRKQKVRCDHCGLEMAAGSLAKHLETQHDVFRSMVLNRDLLVDREPVTYHANPRGVYRGSWDCPFPGCLGTATTKWGLRRHFNDRHPMDLVDIPGEGVYPKCTLCGMQTNFASAPNHERTATCRAGAEKREQHRRAEEAAQAMEETFTAYGVELEQVEVFKYLGRQIRNDDNDTQAIRVQLRKARGVWGRLSRMMRSENASPRVCELFYKATVQAVLLFGSETWCLSPANLRLLEGFHVRAARRMTGMMPKKKSDGTWEYPDSAEVLKAACLHTVEDHITVRRRTVMKFVVDRPIYKFFREAERHRGFGSHLFW